MWVAFAVQKLLTFFQQKISALLYIESAKTVNEMTLNELVKLTTLWTTGPCLLKQLWQKQDPYIVLVSFNRQTYKNNLQLEICL